MWHRVQRQLHLLAAVRVNVELHISWEIDPGQEADNIDDATVRLPPGVPDRQPVSINIAEAMSVLAGSPEFSERFAAAFDGWHGTTLRGVYAPTHPRPTPPPSRTPRPMPKT